MSRHLAYAVALLFAVYFHLAIWSHASYVDPAPTGKIVVMLMRPFVKFGNGAIATGWIPSDRVLENADTVDNPRQSTVALYEDGKRLWPAHSTHGEIMNIGQGRYSHWNQSIVFSASDNSDPNTNGRLYFAVVVPPPEPQISQSPEFAPAPWLDSKPQ